VTQPPYAPPQQQPYGQQPPYGPPPGAPYGQPPQGQPPFGQLPQAPQKTPIWKKTWFRIVAGLFVIAVIASAVNGGDKTDTTASGGSDAPAAVDSAAPAEVVEETPAEPAMPGLNQPAADGDFSFVVSGVDCSLTEIGNQYFGTKAQGQFCVVSVAVTNIGDSAGAFFGDNSKLLNADGQEFSADSEAAIYLEDSDSLFEEINPGNTLNSKVVFDVPAGTTPTVIELHDSAFSGGVQVALQ
jgi:hypothetical protein